MSLLQYGGSNWEFSYVEMISTMIYQLTRDATMDELRKVGLNTHSVEQKN